ncbi:aminodeoxychorismate lyase [Pseudomarimonas arenosa]|uniref:Aminodeoxychorismate lyase n=1 Tax=Pseudomarimonas arenosa TaxID=2774145 RepID=A0AAW3ZNK5_9GAMM|nr:aminodeoxychorismate lyase [Pseudomarimonas arenosa]MBD8527686.1 aminodeoxychorismate lyase [Pseudomarimonas arenosa]
MSERLASLVDGVPTDRVPIDDRGLLYGDGVFETILLEYGQPLWWTQHIDRLCQGAQRLGMDAPAAKDWQRELDLLLRALDVALPTHAVLRISLTRGSGGRGYSADASRSPRRLMLLFPAPQSVDGGGLRVRCCALRLAAQPALAGIKHLNRLEQVLARLEWQALPSEQRSHFDEGLLLDAAGDVVCATIGNLLWLDRHGWHTPPIVDCGIAGICRAELLQWGWVDECSLSASNLDQVEGLAVCNSVRGILPVASLDERVLPGAAAASALRSRLLQQEPAFDY